MNRKNLTAAVLAGLAGAAGIVGSAQAVNINPDGVGQVLIYPYYTVNGGNFTALSVINTTGEAKAVKVRFLEGQNSQEVLDFNMYMSAYDVWAAAVFDNDGVPTLVVNDTTCTVPYLYMNSDDAGNRTGKQAFLPYELDDGGSTSLDRAREGHFEMIEMGTLVNGTNFSAKAATHLPPPADAEPGTPAMPPLSWIQKISEAQGFEKKRTCGQLLDAWTDPDDTVPGDEGYWLNTVSGSPLIDLSAPSGGLFGGAAIVNADGGTMYSYDATAINGFSVGLDDGEIPPTPLHQIPGFVLPGLNSGDQLDATIFLDNGVALTETLTRGVDAISYVFMHDQIMNEYTTEGKVGGQTEWVITFPTKQFYVFKDPAGSVTPPVAPFTSVWDGMGACEVVKLDRMWDREEQTAGIVPGEPVPPIVSPAPPPDDEPGVVPFSLCYETSVIRFGDAEDTKDDSFTTEILGSSNWHNLDNVIQDYEFGWARLQLSVHPETNADGEIIPGGKELTRTMGGLNGLPVAGFAVQRFSNDTLQGNNVMANYGGIFKHKATRLVSLSP